MCSLWFSHVRPIILYLFSKQRHVATPSQEYLIPLFLQALDFLNKTTSLRVVKMTTKTTTLMVTTPLHMTARRYLHSFTLENCNCTRTLNIRCKAGFAFICFVVLKFQLSSATSQLHHMLSGCLEPWKSSKGLKIEIFLLISLIIELSGCCFLFLWFSELQQEWGATILSGSTTTIDKTLCFKKLKENIYFITNTKLDLLWQGIEENLALMSELYGPSWSMRVYYSLDGSNPSSTIDFLCRFHKNWPLLMLTLLASYLSFLSAGLLAVNFYHLKACLRQKLLSFEGLPVPNQLWTSARPRACLATRGSTSLKCSPGQNFFVPQVNTYFRRTDGKYVAPAEALYVVAF